MSDLELDRLGDDALVAYVVRAREAGDLDAMRVGIQVLTFGLQGLVRSRVRVKMERRPEVDVDMVTAEVIGGAELVAFRGETIGEFRTLLNRILARRVADYYRSLRGQADQDPLVEEHGGEEEVWGDVLRDPGDFSGIEAHDLLDRHLAELSPAHRAAVGRRLAGYSAREAAELVNNHFDEELPTPMTPQNVDQIFSRFRRRHRDLIEEAERDARPSDNGDDDD